MRKPKPKALPPEIVQLRSLPIDQRAEVLIAMFRFCTSEFAAMVLEHVKPPSKAKRDSPVNRKRSRP